MQATPPDHATVPRRRPPRDAPAPAQHKPIKPTSDLLIPASGLDQTRRQAAARIDALNRPDLDAVAAMMHQDMTTQGRNTSRHHGREQGRTEGKPAYLKFLTWLPAQEPPGCHAPEHASPGPLATPSRPTTSMTAPGS